MFALLCSTRYCLARPCMSSASHTITDYPCR
jgi:hypothetical protein